MGAKKGEVILQPVNEYDEQKIKIKEFIPQLPFKVKIVKGTKFYDVAYFNDPFNFAISENLKNVLVENEISGWDCYPLEIEGTDKKYYGFTVTGRCGPIKKPSTKGWVKGYEFDLDSWDKSDFFRPDETLHVFFNEKVKLIIEKEKITNFGIVNIADYEWYNLGKN